MKQFKCDKCGKAVNNEHQLNELFEKYQTESIKHMCGDCLNSLQSDVWRIEAKHRGKAEAEIRALVGKPVVKRPCPTVARLLAWWRKPFSNGVTVSEWLTPAEQFAVEVGGDFDHWHRVAHGRRFFAEQFRCLVICVPVMAITTLFVMASGESSSLPSFSPWTTHGWTNGTAITLTTTDATATNVVIEWSAP